MAQRQPNHSLKYWLFYYYYHYYYCFPLLEPSTVVPYMWECVVPLVVKHEVMSHTELLLRVNIHWLLVIHSWRTHHWNIYTQNFNFLSPQKNKNSPLFFFKYFWRQQLTVPKMVALRLDRSHLREALSFHTNISTSMAHWVLGEKKWLSWQRSAWQKAGVCIGVSHFFPKALIRQFFFYFLLPLLFLLPLQESCLVVNVSAFISFFS